MCSKSHCMAVSASELPVARSAFWHRIVGKPIASSWAIASALNSGCPAGTLAEDAQSERNRALTFLGFRIEFLLARLSPSA